MRTYRFALRPGWLVGHLVCVALMIVMIELGLWQLRVSEHKHFSVQNFGYAIQWWLFAGFTVLMWARALRDHARRTEQPDRVDAELRSMTEPPPTYRRYVPPVSTPATDDPQLAAYNEYLSRLAARDSKERPAP